MAIRVAYADPPYPGMAHYYTEKTEVDHAALIRELERDYPDGWALSTASTTLFDVGDLIPTELRPKVRIAAWVKPFAFFKPGVRLAYTWEPVLIRGGRQKWSKSEPTVQDHIAVKVTQGRGMMGVKPREFCWWLFRALGLQPGDEFVDLFPGSGAVTREWEAFSRQPELFPGDALAAWREPINEPA